jgi:hypothetical protein
MIKPVLLSVIVLQSITANADIAGPTYPCREYSVHSTCDKAPFLPPPPESKQDGIQVSCQLVSKDFQSTSTQTVVPQQDCIYRQCKPAGYGLIWYLTRRELTTKDAPRVILSTDNFVKDKDSLDDLRIRISFKASPAFFDSSDVNAENDQLRKQSFTTRLKKLDEGVTKTIKVGVVGSNGMEFVDSLLSCNAN